MNFLSHYYFDRDVTDCYHILGTVLPDLLKNADKTIVLHPESLHHNNSHVNSIIKGWNKHLEVDRHFHSSDFFKNHSHQLKKVLLPAMDDSPVKPFFLGHIAIEIILDSLLITHQKINVDSFYDHLSNCHEDIIRAFFDLAGLNNSDFFFRYFERFKKDRYLHTYAEMPQITYALKRICMRIWQNPFTTEQEQEMTRVIRAYNTSLLSDYLLIFNEIEEKLMPDNGS
ncbi:hypothetical protein ACFQZS_00235 [Mucilaginibacter calamicampi]|uniref:Acyl carrier protein phosphodiesterase n=1 Tax=Mucilaginibacter calamicampi TaxID=1302352 RepID=A0ABW2YQF6_9SPHI